MQLKSVHLKNIKNHEDLKVDFTDGITAIIGKNGVGKTTILESIGFILFDYLPYKQKDFITYGKTWGQIELTISDMSEFLDENVGKMTLEKTYGPMTISRRIGNNPYYKIIDILSSDGIENDIIGKEDVQEFLRQHLAISMDLEKLYSEIIAIPQVFATAHFLLPKTQRSQIFDSIMGVDIYRNCWAKLQKVEKILNDEINCLKTDGSVLIHDTKDYKEKKANLDKLSDEVQILTANLKSLRVAYDQLTDDIAELSRQRDLCSEIRYLEDRIDGQKKAIKESQKELAEISVDDKEREEVVSKLNKYGDEDTRFNKTVDALHKLTSGMALTQGAMDGIEGAMKTYKDRMLGYGSLVKLADELKSAEDDEYHLLTQMTGLQSKLSELHKLNDDGLCPVTKNECNVIKDYNVSNEIKIYTEKLLSIEEKHAKAKDKSLECFIANDEKDKLDNMKSTIEENKVKYKDYKEEIKYAKEEEKILINRLELIKGNLELYETLKERYYKIEAKKERVEQLEKYIEELTGYLEKETQDLAKIKEETADYDEDTLDDKQADEVDIRDTLSRMEEQCSQKQIQRLSEQDEILVLEGKLEMIIDYKKKLSKASKTLDKTINIRKIFNKVGSKLVDSYLNNISYEANLIYQELADTNKILVWENDYEVKVGNQKFIQLSGGEQMSVAISIRLALLKYFSNIKLIVLDEPTANLDDDHRDALAESIRKLEGFSQILVITHDDTFSTVTDNVVKL